MGPYRLLGTQVPTFRRQQFCRNLVHGKLGHLSNIKKGKNCPSPPPPKEKTISWVFLFFPCFRFPSPTIVLGWGSEMLPIIPSECKRLSVRSHSFSRVLQKHIIWPTSFVTSYRLAYRVNRSCCVTGLYALRWNSGQILVWYTLWPHTHTHISFIFALHSLKVPHSPHVCNCQFTCNTLYTSEAAFPRLDDLTNVAQPQASAWRFLWRATRFKQSVFQNCAFGTFPLWAMLVR